MCQLSWPPHIEQQRMSPISHSRSTAEFFREKLTNPSNKLCFGTLNICSLLKKCDVVRCLLKQHDIRILGLTETWLSTSISNSLLALNGYTIFRGDRETRGGGVMLLIDNRYESHFINSSTCPSIEYIHVNVKRPFTKPLDVVCLYRPPSSSICDFIEALRTLVLSISTQLIVMGDINIDTSSINRNRTEFRRLLKELGLVQINNKPTRLTQVSKTTIDVILISKYLESSIKDVKTTTTFESDHELVTAEIKKPRLKSLLVSKEVTRYPQAEVRRFKEGLSQMDITNTNEHLPTIMDNIIRLSSTFPKVPLSYRSTAGLDIWGNPRLFHLICNSDFKMRRARLSRKPHLYTAAIKYRKFVRAEITAAKKLTIQSQIQIAGNDPKKMWNVIRPFISKNETKPPLTMTDAKGTHTDTMDIANAFNDYFCDAVQALVSTTSLHPAFYTTSGFPTPLSCIFDFEEVLPKMMEARILKVTKKSTGMNSVPGKIINFDIPFFTHLMTNVVNDSFKSDTFPSIWKHGIVNPRFKAGNQSEIANYRPIAKLPNLSKVLEAVAAKQITDYVLEHELLYAHQSGFRKRHSTLTATTDLISCILSLRDKKMLVAVIFIDFTKAFDVINHNALLLKLQLQFNFSSKVTDWLSSYLRMRHQVVDHLGSTSNPRIIKSGVAQGSILGPLLFLLYINDINNCLSKAEARLFADDTAIVVSAKNANDLVQNCRESINDMQAYCVVNSLFIHPLKTKIMFFQKMNIPTDEIKLNGRQIEAVNSYKYLGYTIDNKLSLVEHCRKVIGKIGSSRAALHRCCRFLNPYCINLVANALVASHINFSHTLLVVSDRASFKKLRSTYNSVKKILDSNKVYWNSLECRLLSLNLKFLSNIVTGNSPCYLRRHLQLELMPRRQNKFKCSFINATHSTKGIEYWGPRLADKFNIDLKTATMETIIICVQHYLACHEECSTFPYNSPNSILRSL